MTNKKVETLWENYEVANKQKAAVKYPFVTKEKFFEIHREFPKDKIPLPSKLASQLVKDYKWLHKHLEYLQPEIKKQCLICNRKEEIVQKGRKKKA